MKRVIHRADGIIDIKNAQCKVSKNLLDILVLNAPKQSRHLHIYFGGGKISDEDKKGANRHKNITKKEFDNLFKSK